MATYKAPLRDMQFVMQDLLNIEKHYQSLPDCDEVNQELIDAILDEASKFSEEVVAPLNAVGDEVGCRLVDEGEVRTPPGFKEAYQQYVEGGWPSLEQPTDYGGQGLPMSLGTTIREMNGTANWSWAMYPGLSHGAVETIEAHGSEEQKAIFMEPLVSGRWTGTMCLTEAHCGTDLGLLKTRAEQTPDGTYRITGSKLFVSSGEHDLAENIVHIVLARLPDGGLGALPGRAGERRGHERLGHGFERRTRLFQQFERLPDYVLGADDARTFHPELHHFQSDNPHVFVDVERCQPVIDAYQVEVLQDALHEGTVVGGFAAPALDPVRTTPGRVFKYFNFVSGGM